MKRCVQTGKQRHESLQSAEKHRASLLYQGSALAQVYICPYCNDFHVTSGVLSRFKEPKHQTNKQKPRSGP